MTRQARTSKLTGNTGVPLRPARPRRWVCHQCRDYLCVHAQSRNALTPHDYTVHVSNLTAAPCRAPVVSPGVLRSLAGSVLTPTLRTAGASYRTCRSLVSGVTYPCRRLRRLTSVPPPPGTVAPLHRPPVAIRRRIASRASPGGARV